MIATFTHTDAWRDQRLTVTRQDTDIRFKNESHFLYHLKLCLNTQGFDLIKKRMWKDGHMVCDTQQYLRSRRQRNETHFVVYDDCYALRNAATDFNEIGEISLACHWL